MKQDFVAPRRAFISVSDKSGIGALALELDSRGIEIVSTGGTAKALKDIGCPVTYVDKLTGFPEMMDGRLKTLHPKVHGGLLAIRDKREHLAAMDEHDIKPIDILIVNLYPFKRTVESKAPFEECVEQIDIGGPAMLRAAAKNHAWVAPVVDPGDYVTLLNHLQKKGATSYSFRKELAGKVYAHTARYDADIARYFNPDFSIAN